MECRLLLSSPYDVGGLEEVELNAYAARNKGIMTATIQFDDRWTNDEQYRPVFRSFVTVERAPSNLHHIFVVAWRYAPLPLEADSQSFVPSVNSLHGGAEKFAFSCLFRLVRDLYWYVANFKVRCTWTSEMSREELQ